VSLAPSKPLDSAVPSRISAAQPSIQALTGSSNTTTPSVVATTGTRKITVDVRAAPMRAINQKNHRYAKAVQNTAKVASASQALMLGGSLGQVQ
jgi:hypothetical protein